MEVKYFLSQMEECEREQSFLNMKKKSINNKFIMENAPFKIGDVIITKDGVKGKIVKFMNHDSEFISADWRKMNKDGSFSGRVTHISYVILHQSKLYNEK